MLTFSLAGAPSEIPVQFEVTLEDGDFNIFANGVSLGYISWYDGKLHLHHITEEERELIPGLSLSNGRLTVAE